MTDANDFPKIDGGWCDGLGCGKGLCFCGERLAMCEEFQRVYNKPWKKSYDENPDIDCDRVEHMWRFGTKRAADHHKKEMQEMQTIIDMLKQKLHQCFVTYVDSDGVLRVKRCDSTVAANTFMRENNLSGFDCKVVSDGVILTRDERSKMWYSKTKEQDVQ